jgi:hypothetical protein
VRRAVHLDPLNLREVARVSPSSLDAAEGL